MDKTTPSNTEPHKAKRAKKEQHFYSKRMSIENHFGALIIFRQRLEWNGTGFLSYFVVVVYLIITWFSHLYNINIYYIKEMWVALFVTFFFINFTWFTPLLNTRVSRKYSIYSFIGIYIHSCWFTTYKNWKGIKTLTIYLIWIGIIII